MAEAGGAGMTAPAGSLAPERGAAPVLDRGPTVGDPSAARSPHLLTVVTPEGVLLEFRAAGVGSRLLAAAIDLFCQFMALLVLIFVFALALVVVNETLGVILLVVVIFLIIYGYPAATETLWDGRTLGKAVLGIRVITTEGGPVGFRHAAIRSMLATVDFWLPPGGLLALTAALVTQRSQRLGDLAAGTIVVRRARAATSPVFFAPAYGVERLTSQLDTSALTPQQYGVIRDYLLRLGELMPERAAALGQQLSVLVGQITGTPKPDWLDPPRYLASVLCAHQTRFRPAPGPVAVGPGGMAGVSGSAPPPPPGWFGPPPGWGVPAYGAPPPYGPGPPPAYGAPPAYGPGPPPAYGPPPGPDLGSLPPPVGPPVVGG
ncbi:MAG: RDD family protein [Acidimicrobiales bacterium]